MVRVPSRAAETLTVTIVQVVRRDTGERVVIRSALAVLLLHATIQVLVSKLQVPVNVLVDLVVPTAMFLVRRDRMDFPALEMDCAMPVLRACVIKIRLLGTGTDRLVIFAMMIIVGVSVRSSVLLSVVVSAMILVSVTLKENATAPCPPAAACATPS